MGKKTRRSLDTAQGTLIEAPAGGRAKHEPRVDFRDPDPRALFVGSERLEAFLGSRGMSWIVRLREQLEKYDWSALEASYRGGGRPPFHPRIVLGLMIYGISLGLTSLRELESLSVRDVGAWFLTGGEWIDFTTICKFLLRHEEVITDGFFVGITRTLVGQLRLEAGPVAGDGTVVEAAASRFGLMKAEAAREMATAAAEVAATNPEDEELRQRAEHLDTVASAASYRQARSGQKGRTIVVSPEEPDAVLQPRKDGVNRPSYKPSLLVHPSGLIVGQHVDPSSENRALEPMMAHHEAIFQAPPTTALLDAGYASLDVLAFAVQQQLDVLIPTGKAWSEEDILKPGHRGLIAKTDFVYDEKADTYRCPAGALLTRSYEEQDERGRKSRRYRTNACLTCPLKSKCTRGERRTIKRYEGEELKEAMAQVMKQPAAREMYANRATWAEPPFARIGCRQRLKRFRRKGLQKVRMEFTLHCIAFNLRRADRLLEGLVVVIAVAYRGSQPVVLVVMGFALAQEPYRH
jgi:transposase